MRTILNPKALVIRIPVNERFAVISFICVTVFTSIFVFLIYGHFAHRLVLGYTISNKQFKWIFFIDLDQLNICITNDEYFDNYLLQGGAG